MVIFIRELVRNRKSFLIWTISLVILNALMMFLYPSMAEQADSLKEMMSGYPQGFMDAFGLDRLNLSEILHFFGVESYLFIMLFGGMYAMILGVSIISKEESDKTIEFLLAKPITRNSIITAKVLCVFLYILLLNFLFSFTNFIFFEIVKIDDYSIRGLLLLSVGPLLLHLFLASIGVLISIFVVKAKAVYPISIGIVLGMYFISIASLLTDKLSAMKYFTPFRYFEAADLIHDESISSVYLILTFSVIAITIALIYVFYNKKDISV